MLERTTFVIAAGGDVVESDVVEGDVHPEATLEMVDPAVSALSHMGVELDPAWGLDGQVIWEPTNDPFDTLMDELQPAQDETGIPEDVLGWTATPPEGWRVETDPAMQGTGMTEWRGWTFATEDFWTSADEQGREDFYRGRSVMAVADPDEWDDLGSPSSTATFDTSLISPAYPIAGGGTITIGFDSHYRQSGQQTAQVLVSFDDGDQVEVLRYDEQPMSANAGGDVTSREERIEVAVPVGATFMTVTWRMSEAGNDWFWAVDNPAVTSAAPTDPASVWVTDLDATIRPVGSKRWKGDVAVQVRTDTGLAVEDAQVQLRLTYDDRRPDQMAECTTGQDGRCAVDVHPRGKTSTVTVQVED